jgi:hypothetical protein
MSQPRLPRPWLLLGLLALAFPLPARGGDTPPGPAAHAPGAAAPGVPDKELQARIDAAIERGAAWLRSQQKANGSIGGIQVQGQTQYTMGSTALAGLALLAAGATRDDEAIQHVQAYLKEQDDLRAGAGSRTTYDTGTLLMFLTAYYRPIDADLGPGHTVTGHGRGNPCDLPPDVRRWVQDLVSWLVSVRKPATCTWGYPANRDDHSNTQYAFL